MPQKFGAFSVSLPKAHLVTHLPHLQGIVPGGWAGA